MSKRPFYRILSRFKVMVRRLYAKDFRSLTLIYILALSSIAVMALGFQFYKFIIHADQLRAVNAIRLIDKQTSLAEVVYGRTVGVQISPNLERKKEGLEKVKVDLLQLERSHNEIVALFSSYDCESLDCAIFLDKNVFSEMYKLAANSDSVRQVDFSLENVLDTLKNYRIFLESSAAFYEARAKSNTHSLILNDIIFIILLIVMLLVQAFFVFRPAVNKLNEALSVRSDFLSRISHEIRNPMNAILGMADILKSTRLNSEQTQYVENLQRSGNVLLDMLNSLVDFSGLENRAIKLKAAKFNIYKLVDKCVDVVSVQAHDKGLEIYVDVDPNIPPYLIGDSIRIEQVFLNLLNNAVKFTQRGYVLLKAEVHEQSAEDVVVKFSVEDSGIGIESSQIKNVFDSFVQEDSSIKRRFGGSGLGLAISREIVHLMGSTIEVSSEKNVGSTFKFQLRLEKTNEKITKSAFKKIDHEIIYVSSLKNDAAIANYLEECDIKYTMCRDIEKLPSLLKSRDHACDVIADDSLGIINMINVASVSKEANNVFRMHALVRTNFPKENIDLIRKNGFKKFLIKPFRIWHLFRSSSSISDWLSEHEGEASIEDIQREVQSRNIKILAVDDSNDNLFLIKEILDPITKDIDFASNGLEAINQFERKQYDIVFMDIQMPVMDGYTAIRKIRAKDKKDMPIYAVTAHAGLVDEKKCIEAGFSGRITKPIDRKKIYDLLKDVFGIKISAPSSKGVGETPQFVKKLLPSYFKVRDQDLELVRKALSTRDFESIKSIGHRIKGSARSYGFEEVGRLSQKLEDAALQDNLEQCNQIVDEIEKIITEAKQDYNQENQL